jgi:hypothetical protein
MAGRGAGRFGSITSAKLLVTIIQGGSHEKEKDAEVPGSLK